MADTAKPPREPGHKTLVQGALRVSPMDGRWFIADTAGTWYAVDITTLGDVLYHDTLIRDDKLLNVPEPVVYDSFASFFNEESRVAELYPHLRFARVINGERDLEGDHPESIFAQHFDGPFDEYEREFYREKYTNGAGSMDPLETEEQRTNREASLQWMRMTMNGQKKQKARQEEKKRKRAQEERVRDLEAKKQKLEEDVAKFNARKQKEREAKAAKEAGEMEG